MATSLFWWDPAAARFTATTSGNPSAKFTVGTNISYMGLAFGGADGTDEYCYFTGIVPDSYTAAGTVTIRLYWVADTSSTAAKTVEWEVDYIGVANDEALDGSLNGATTITDTVIAAADLHVASGNITTPALAPGDVIVVQVKRDADSGGSGSETQDAVLVGLQLLEA